MFRERAPKPCNVDQVKAAIESTSGGNTVSKVGGPFALPSLLTGAKSTICAGAAQVSLGGSPDSPSVAIVQGDTDFFAMLQKQPPAGYHASGAAHWHENAKKQLIAANSLQVSAPGVEDVSHAFVIVYWPTSPD